MRAPVPVVGRSKWAVGAVAGLIYSSIGVPTVELGQSKSGVFIMMLCFCRGISIPRVEF